MTLKKLASRRGHIEAPRREPAGRRAVGPSRPPGAKATPHRQHAQNASPTARTPALQPSRKLGGGPTFHARRLNRSPPARAGGTAGRWASPAPGSQSNPSPPTRPKRVPNRTNPGTSTLPQARGGPVPARRTLAPGVLPSARLASPRASSGRAGAISPDARFRHPAFRSLVGNRASPSGLRSVSQRRLDWHRPTPREHALRGPPHFRAARPARAPPYKYASAVSAGAGPYLSGAIVKLARPWLTLRTAAE